jgi:hypothetical protein
MKRIVMAVLFGVASLNSISTKAQVNINVNIGAQPQWGPSGYNHVDYYYLPGIDAYYNVPSKQYIYLSNGSWVWRNSLPSRYNGYDLYNAYKVVMNSPKPYLSHNQHVKQYNQYKNYSGKQTNIRDSKDNRYDNGRTGRPSAPVYGRKNSPANDNGNSGNRNSRGAERGGRN